MQWNRIVAMTAMIAGQATAAQFQFSTLIRYGGTAGGPANWELAAGNSAGSLAATANLTPSFATRPSRTFQISYTQATNTATLRVYDSLGTGGTSDAVSFNPAGGAAVAANAIWTLPASSFFVQAAAAPISSQVSIQNLSLVTGTVLAPLQTTTLTASQAAGVGAGVVNLPGGLVFVGNASGNWQLQGTVTMTSIGGNPSSTGLQFGLTASASDVPEPMTSAMIGLGLVALALRGQSLRKYLPKPGA